MTKTCSASGCRRRARKRGLCIAHYLRHWKGQPLEAPIAKCVRGSIKKRLCAHVKIDAKTGCHLWTGHRDALGYGLMCVDRAQKRTHRLAWEAAHGPIPEGMIVMHLCDNPPCCSPAHLKLGTPADNARDRMSKGRGAGARARDLEDNPQWR